MVVLEDDAMVDYTTTDSVVSGRLDSDQQALFHSSTAMDGSEEAGVVAEYEDTTVVQDGDPVYIISSRWFDQWKEWSGYGEEGSLVGPRTHPGPINNSDLLLMPNAFNSGDEVDNIGLKEDLQEGQDYMVLSQSSWTYLVKRHDGGPIICRRVFNEGRAQNKKPRVLLYPSKVEVVLSSAPNDAVEVEVDKWATLAELKRRACEAVKVQEVDVDMWDYYNHNKYKKLEANLDETLDSARIIDGQAILLEEKTSDMGDLDVSTVSSSRSLSYYPTTRNGYSSYQEDSVMERSGAHEGLVGLQNLGNTCFMNSSLQCLAHAVPLMRVFLSKQYTKDINTSNPLGMQGELAEAFGLLMENLWRRGVGYVTPRGFKARIGKFAPQFSGYQQHDSQEFLAFLLDGLHEDLNRIKNKPYLEEKDAGSRSDDEIANEAWNNYRLRNDSAIVDHFQGLYKSTLDCPRCGYESRKFDPFMYLSLPLPESRVKVLSVVLVHIDGNHLPVTYAVEVPQTGTLKDLYNGLARLADIQVPRPEEVLCIVKVHSFPRTVTVFPEPRTRLSEFGENDTLVVYRYPNANEGPMSGKQQVIVYHRKAQYPQRVRKLFAAPLVLWLPPGTAYEPVQLVEQRVGAFNEYLVSPDAPVNRCIEAALKPFKRRKVDDPNPAEGAGCAVEGNGWCPAVDGQDHLPLCGQPQALADSPEVTRAEKGPDVPCSGAPGASYSSRDNNGMTSAVLGVSSNLGINGPILEEPSNGGLSEREAVQPGTPGADASPSSSLLPDPQIDSSSASVSRMDEDQSEGRPEAEGATPVTGTVPVVQPFNMWHEASGRVGEDTGSCQDPSSGFWGDGVGPSGADARDQFGGPGSVSLLPPAPEPCYHLKLATDRGTTDMYSYSLPKRDSHTIFALDWTEGGSDVYDLSAMERPEDHSSVLQHLQRRSSGPQPVSLSACVEAFLQPEQLSEADLWYCSRCKEHVQADKKLDLWSLPEVLVVHLKRFTYTRYHREKLDTLVNFPLEGLDLTQYLMRQEVQPVPPVYDLFAVSNHYGGLGGGHYTAYAKLPGAQQWYCFDDSSVSEVSSSRVHSSAAYVLFYRRRHEGSEDTADLVASLMAKQHNDMEAATHVEQEEGNDMDVEDDLAIPTCAVQSTSPRWHDLTDLGDTTQHGGGDSSFPGYFPPMNIVRDNSSEEAVDAGSTHEVDDDDFSGLVDIQDDVGGPDMGDMEELELTDMNAFGHGTSNLEENRGTAHEVIALSEGDMFD